MNDLVIAVTGADGFIGRPLCARLRKAGHTVIPVPRQMGLIPEADVLIHLAGESPAGLWTGRKRAAIRNSRVEGTRRVVNRLRESIHRPRVFLCASATGLYGHRPGEILTEESSPGSGFRAEVCLAWEREARAAEELGIRTVLLRFGPVLDLSGGYLGKMLPFMSHGLCFILGNVEDRFAWVSLEDALGLIEFAIRNEEIRGPLNVVAPEPATQGEFARMAASLAGRRVAGRLPRTLLRGLLGELATVLVDVQAVRPAQASRRGYPFRHGTLESWASEALARSACEPVLEPAEGLP